MISHLRLDSNSLRNAIAPSVQQEYEGVLLTSEAMQKAFFYYLATNLARSLHQFAAISFIVLLR